MEGSQTVSGFQNDAIISTHDVDYNDTLILFADLLEQLVLDARILRVILA
jgi:hypothetical protein